MREEIVKRDKLFALGCALITLSIIGLAAGCASPAPSVPVTEVSLDKVGIGLVVGESKTLIATVLPATATEKGVSWKSDDETIATVDKDGLVTGVKAGQTKIIVTSDDGGFTDECGVAVSALKVTGVKIDSVLSELKVGNSFQFEWTVSPEFASDKNVTWTSSDTSIMLPVANELGKFVALKAGTVTITVTTADGGHTDTSKIEIIP